MRFKKKKQFIMKKKKQKKVQDNEKGTEWKRKET